jgi:hypothetical protein
MGFILINTGLVTCRSSFKGPIIISIVARAMHMARQIIGEIQQMLKRWEQQISKRPNTDLTTAPITDANGTQVNATGSRSAVFAEARDHSASCKRRFATPDHVGAFCPDTSGDNSSRGSSTSLELRKDRNNMNQNSKNWLALNASGLTWLAVTLGIMAFAVVLAAWSVQPHAIQ